MEQHGPHRRHLQHRSCSTDAWRAGAQTLRAWEDRYQQIVPARSSGGQRLCSRDQVDQLSFIRNQIEQGLQPADAHQHLLAPASGEAASIPVEQRPSAPASVDAATTVLLAERDSYAAEFANYFLRTEGYVVRIIAQPRRGSRNSPRPAAERACGRSADRRWRRSGAVPHGSRERFGAGARRLRS